MPGKLNASVLDVGNKQECCKNSVCPTRSQRKANWEVAKGQGVVEVKHSRPECITGPEHAAQVLLVKRDPHGQGFVSVQGAVELSANTCSHV